MLPYMFSKISRTLFHLLKCYRLFIMRFTRLLTFLNFNKVWAIADSKRQGFLGFKEFITAMQVLISSLFVLWKWSILWCLSLSPFVYVVSFFGTSWAYSPQWYFELWRLVTGVPDSFASRVLGYLATTDVDCSVCVFSMIIQ